MPVLRSRKVDSVTQNEQSLKPVQIGVQIEPPTPVKEVESTNKSSHERTPSPLKPVHLSDKPGSTGSIDSESASNKSLRRSARLSSKSPSYNLVENVSSRRKRKFVNHESGEASSPINVSVLFSANEVKKETGVIESDVTNVRASSEMNTSNDYEAIGVFDSDLGTIGNDKEDSELVQESDARNTSQVTESLTFEEKGGSSGEKTRKRLTTEDKLKGVMVDDDDKGKLDLLEKKIKTSDTEEMKIDDVNDTIIMSTVKDELQVNLQQETIEKAETSNRNKERFKSVARENASRFAYFSVQEEKEEDPVNEDDDDEDEIQPDANKDNIEDWPGPFSTAMKIIKDRQTNTGQQNSLTSEKLPSVPLTWVPKVKQEHQVLKRSPPSLQELCMSIMAENVDAITSLESVPDVIRHKLTQKLCDNRKMNHHFFNLLACGSPSEIRVRDCSWLTEEQFTKTINTSDTSKLTVLQLDQCGRCLPDYVLFATLGRMSLCELTNISLRGACRLSDAGLNALVSSAPALRSINLGCCSLLTCDGIINLADKLGPILKELYLDECFGLDAMKILPALIKLEKLEVLSISRFETVNDTFIKRLMRVLGHNLKELVLADCTKLTDKSLKAIAESCPGLCSIDLSNLCKLTDTAIVHLANGCQAIQTMKFSRNTFSDEAIAAYLEACGKSLKELSLNHVNKVANHTALSLAKHARNLETLDLSWCRDMSNEAVGLIADSCLSLKTLRLFGCTQITHVFLDGHSNEGVKVIGLKGSQILKNIDLTYLPPAPLRYSSAA